MIRSSTVTAHVFNDPNWLFLFVFILITSSQISAGRLKKDRWMGVCLCWQWGILASCLAILDIYMRSAYEGHTDPAAVGGGAG